MKEDLTKTVRVSGQGDTKQKAFAAALNSIQRTILKGNENIILRIEPKEVSVIRADKKQKKEKFMFFFLPRVTTQYFIELDVTVDIALIKVVDIDFKEIS